MVLQKYISYFMLKNTGIFCKSKNVFDELVFYSITKVIEQLPVKCNARYTTRIITNQITTFCNKLPLLF